MKETALEYANSLGRSSVAYKEACLYARYSHCLNIHECNSIAKQSNSTKE